MSDWLMVCSIWAMCALCAVLFIRGATPQVQRAPVRSERDPAAGGRYVSD